MRKFYYIVSIQELLAGEKQIVGAVTADWIGGHGADPEQERLLILDLQAAGATVSLTDAMRDNNYSGGASVRVFERRAAAREALTKLNSENSFCVWRIRAVGQFARDNSRKPAGWEVTYNDGDSVDENRKARSACNEEEFSDTCGGERVKVNGSLVFKLRKDARAAAAVANSEDYSVRPVFADA